MNVSIVVERMRRLDKGVAILAGIFILTLPLLNPMLRSDAVGYYAYVRSLVVDGDLQFRDEWEHGRETSLEPPRLFKGDPLFVPRQTLSGEYYLTTSTGFTPNRYAVGPALLWAPFFVTAHVLGLLLKAAGVNVQADGYSPVYLYSVGFGSALYAFIGILLIYKIGLQYFSRKVVLFSTIVVWFASSLIAYMYAHPLVSHAVSLFAVSLLIYYWFVRREYPLSLRDSFVVGILTGLVVSIRLNDVLFCLIPLFGEVTHWSSMRGRLDAKAVTEIICRGGAFVLGCILALLPTLVIGEILYGRWTLTYYPYAHTAEEFARVYKWMSSSPAFLKVLFSSMHGLFSWTPVLLASFLGMFLFMRKDSYLGISLVVLFLLQVYVYGGWVNNWEQGSSFGARAFINFTPMYVLGLASLISALKKSIPPLILGLIGMLFVVWNLGFLVQFGLGLIPRWDYIDWGQMLRNQFVVLPEHFGSKILSLVPPYAGIGALLLGALLFIYSRERIVSFYRSI